jgi:NADPH:quinone reductase
MRAVLANRPGGPHVLEVREVPVPPIRAGHVRVAVRSAGINFRDIQQRRGTAPDSGFPLSPGSDFAGEVTEVGDGVEWPREGDRVFGLSPGGGAYAEQVIVPAAAVRPIPEGVGFGQAAAVPVAGLSATFLLSVAGLRQGMTAVTFAPAGGLGCFLGGLLAEAGVRSIGITSSQEKSLIAQAAGHREVVNYTVEDPVEAVRDLTSGAGVDVVFDSVAGPEFARSFRLLRGGGTVILCGRAAGSPDPAAAWQDLIESRRNLGLRDFYLATHIMEHLSELADRLDALAEGMRSGQLHIPVRAFALEDACRAHELVESGASAGKIVLSTQSPGPELSRGRDVPGARSPSRDATTFAIMAGALRKSSTSRVRAGCLRAGSA